jgi:hypothetical protein
MVLLFVGLRAPGLVANVVVDASKRQLRQRSLRHTNPQEANGALALWWDSNQGRHLDPVGANDSGCQEYKFASSLLSNDSEFMVLLAL